MSAKKQPELAKARPGFRWRVVIFLVVAFCAVVGVWWKLTQPKYPYGETHQCLKVLGGALLAYADDNEGWFPHGKESPEASLSLLSTNAPSVKSLLRGKHLPQHAVDEALTRDGILGPSSCGWHYVEGLRKSDSPELAVLWDRVTGLNHFGQWSRSTQFEVLMLDGSESLISIQEWPKFVDQQKRLLAKTAMERPSNSPPIRWSDEKTLGLNKLPPLTTSNIK